MIFRLSFLVAAAVAAVAVSQVNSDSSKKPNSSNTKHSVKNGSTLQQIEAEEEETLTGEKSQPKEDVKRVTRKIKQELEKRKLILERKLLELYGLKEQQSFIAQLRWNLEDKMKAIDMLNGDIDSLQDEVKNLQEEMRQAFLSNSQLKMAKRMIEKLKTKMDYNASNMRRCLLMLEQQVSSFDSNMETSINDDMNVKKHKAARQVELEFVEMQRMNKELELEKRKLSIKLLDAQARIKALSNMKEDEIVAKIEEETSTLRYAKEGLSKEIERLQMNRFNMVEELVYQRWLNACLRFESENYQASSRRTSNSDISNNESIIMSHMKAKQPVFDDSISSLTSSMDSNEIDSCSTTESSSNSQISITKKFGLMHSIKKWGRSKDDSSGNASSPDNPRSRKSFLGRTRLIRRHSTSAIPSRPSVLSSKDENTETTTQSGRKVVQESSDEPQNTPTFPRARRVSFCDSVEIFTPTFQDAPKSVEKMTDNKQISTQKSSKSAGKLGYRSDSSANTISKDGLDAEVGREIETDQTEKLHSRVSINLTTAALLLLLFILLVCFLLLTKL